MGGGRAIGWDLRCLTTLSLYLDWFNENQLAKSVTQTVRCYS